MLIISYLGKLHGGVNDLKNLATGLRKSESLNDQVEFFTLYYINELDSIIEKTGAKYRYVISHRKNAMFELYANVMAVFVILRYICAGDCVVRMMPHPLDLVFNTLRYLIPNTGCKSLVLRHNPIGFRYVQSNLRNKLISYIDNMNTSESDLVLFLSRNVQRSFEFSNDIASKSYLIGFGSNRFGNATNLNCAVNNPMRLLFFGRILPYKGLDDLLIALAFITCKVKLTIAGQGLSNKQRDLIATASKMCEIDLHDGWISDELAHKLYCETDAVVLPYRSISQSGPLLSAIGYNLPIIAPNLEGVNEFVENSVNGMTYEVGDIHDLARKIDALSEPSNYKNIKLGCIKTAPKFDWGVVGTRLCEAVNNVHA